MRGLHKYPLVTSVYVQFLRCSQWGGGVLSLK